MKKLNLPLPTPDKSGDSLRKAAAYKTLAVEEFSQNIGTDAPPESGDEAVNAAREWVEYDKL